MANSIRPSLIAIVGAGPAGLALARLLHISGTKFVVFERDASPNPSTLFQGGTLDLHAETGQEALRRAGLADQFEKFCRRNATTMTVQDARGGQFGQFGEGRDAPEIDRLQLRQILLDSIPADSVRWGKTLQSVHKAQDSVSSSDWALRFADGSTESGFRLIVGADGAWSKLRNLITSSKPQYSGKTYIEANIAPSNPQYEAAKALTGYGSSMAMAPESCLALQQLSNKSYRMYIGIQAPKDFAGPGGPADVANPEKARAELLKTYFADWAPQLRAYIQHAEGPWRFWPLCRMDPNVIWPTATDANTNTTTTNNNEEKENGSGSSDSQKDSAWRRTPGVTLIGDAAHLATPNGGGVNEGLVDAMRLAERIDAEVGGKAMERHSAAADAEAIERAVVAYEAEMRPRGREHIEAGMFLEDMMWKDDAATNMVAMIAQMHPDSGHGENA